MLYWLLLTTYLQNNRHSMFSKSEMTMCELTCEIYFFIVFVCYDIKKEGSRTEYRNPEFYNLQRVRRRRLRGLTNGSGHISYIGGNSTPLPQSGDVYHQNVEACCSVYVPALVWVCVVKGDPRISWLWLGIGAGGGEDAIRPWFLWLWWHPDNGRHT